MRGTNRDNTPNVRPIEKVQLSTANMKWRAVLVVFILICGGLFIAYGINHINDPKSDYVVINTDRSYGISFANEFVFNYTLGQNGHDTVAENKKVTAEYSRLMSEAAEAFSTELAEVNSHPNEEVAVGDCLYESLKTVTESSDRRIYYAPVFQYYKNLFYSESDDEAKQFDPRFNEDVNADIESIESYINDEKMIYVEIMGDNKVKLCVSPQYLDFCRNDEISEYISFDFYRNAFICDYVADRLTELGYTYGTLSSKDGYTRGLDCSGTEYEYGYLIEGDTLRYNKPVSIINVDEYYSYTYDDGSKTTFLLDTKPFIVYDYEKKCSELLLENDF